jgi:hypothetical protein
MDDLMDYMEDKDLPQELQNRVLNHYRYKWKKSRGTDDTTIENELPLSLRTDIALYLHKVRAITSLEVVLCSDLFSLCSGRIGKNPSLPQHLVCFRVCSCAYDAAVCVCSWGIYRQVRRYRQRNVFSS